MKFDAVALLTLLFGASSDAFTATPPPPTQIAVSAPLPADLKTASNLPSQKELALTSSVTLTSAATASAPSAASNLASTAGISITDIKYDGSVPTTEADEYVVITNGSKSPVDISGYYIYVATTGTQGPTFYFPKETFLKPGTSVRVYTNEIHKETGGYSFRSGKAIWNNKGGLAVLKDGSGKKIGEFKYKPN